MITHILTLEKAYVQLINDIIQSQFERWNCRPFRHFHITKQLDRSLYIWQLSLTTQMQKLQSENK